MLVSLGTHEVVSVNTAYVCIHLSSYVGIPGYLAWRLLVIHPRWQVTISCCGRTTSSTVQTPPPPHPPPPRVWNQCHKVSPTRRQGCIQLSRWQTEDICTVMVSVELFSLFCFALKKSVYSSVCLVPFLHCRGYGAKPPKCRIIGVALRIAM